MAENYRGEISIPVRFITEEVSQWIKEEVGEPIFHGREEYDGVVTFTDHFAPDGLFRDFEESLVQANIPFDRYSEGFGEYMPERKVFRPGVINTTVIVTQHGEPYVETNNLRELLSLSPDEAYLQLAKLIAAADPQVVSLEDIAKELSFTPCGESNSTKTLNFVS